MSTPEKTRAIVLHRFKYKETSLIVKLFTESAGRVTVLIKGAFNKKSPLRANLFQPMFLLQTELSVSPGREIQWLREASADPDLTDLLFDPAKRSIAIFLSEILYHILREDIAHPELFSFLWHSLQILDRTESGTANFHLVFLLKLTRFLGIQPAMDYSEENHWFDLSTGHFCAFPSEHNIPSVYGKTFFALLQCPLSATNRLALNETSRNFLLDKILEFYSLHFPGFVFPKSLPVLRKIFSSTS